MATNQTNKPANEPANQSANEPASGSLDFRDYLKLATVMGYSKGKAKESGRPYVRLDVLVRNKPQWGGEGFCTKAIFLPEEEHNKVDPFIVGKVAHCDWQQEFGGRSQPFNFCFLDD